MEDEKKPEDNGLYRQKSLERVSGPEQLNDYIRVNTPSLWIVLLALCILVAGMLVWRALGGGM